MHAGSHLKTIKLLQDDSSTQSNITAIAEMNAAITDLDAWRKQREQDTLLLREKLLSANAATTAATKTTSSSADDLKFIDDDPVSRAYEARLRSELAALGEKRKKMELELEESSKSPRAPQVYHVPTALLISASQIKALTQDTRTHVGDKSVEDLKNEVRALQYENECTSTLHIGDEEVMKTLAEEGNEFENMAGLSNALETFDSQMADLLLKMDAVDAAAEKSPRYTPRQHVEIDQES
jgi:hypothetical protein|tara:strand:+ start:28 stop:744 length:717 start_codon:yes stop_codon:yes gene_type:complete